MNILNSTGYVYGGIIGLNFSNMTKIRNITMLDNNVSTTSEVYSGMALGLFESHHSNISIINIED